jgi:hypothetical protein
MPSKTHWIYNASSLQHTVSKEKYGVASLRHFFLNFITFELYIYIYIYITYLANCILENNIFLDIDDHTQQSIDKSSHLPSQETPTHGLHRREARMRLQMLDAKPVHL